MEDQVLIQVTSKGKRKGLGLCSGKQTESEYLGTNILDILDGTGEISEDILQLWKEEVDDVYGWDCHVPHRVIVKKQNLEEVKNKIYCKELVYGMMEATEAGPWHQKEPAGDAVHWWIVFSNEEAHSSSYWLNRAHPYSPE